MRGRCVQLQRGQQRLDGAERELQAFRVVPIIDDGAQHSLLCLIQDIMEGRIKTN
jgi:hypothetical protein